MSWDPEPTGGDGFTADDFGAGAAHGGGGFDDAGFGGGFGDGGFGGEAGGVGGGAGGNCRNCGDPDHFARECPQPKKMTGECFNCGEVGHNKAECTNPTNPDRAFDGECRYCHQPGHMASTCPEKGPDICRNCKQEGHKVAECKEKRALDYGNLQSLSADEAWLQVKKADEDKDLDDFRKALKTYAKALMAGDMPVDLATIEQALRNDNMNVYLIAQEKEVSDVMTIVNLDGKMDCKYVLGFFFSPEPRRKAFADSWPKSKEENLERLKDAGIPQDRMIPKCLNCGELGHIRKSCKEEPVERESFKPEIKCALCKEVGHRARDCTQERIDPMMCRNCKKYGHTADNCEEEPDLSGVECRRCHKMGHFSKDCTTGPTCNNCGEEGHMSKECEKPKNPANAKCRNCEEIGHFSRECPKPKDWSKVQCQQCGEFGHTIRRCQKSPPEEGDGGFGDGGFGGGAETFGDAGGFDAEPASAAVGGW